MINIQNKYAGTDNYGHPKTDYIAKVEAMTDEQLVDEIGKVVYMEQKLVFHKTEYSRMPNSINNHTMRSFYWFDGKKTITYLLDRETDTEGKPYRLYEVGNGMIFDYFGGGWTWEQVRCAIEFYLTVSKESK